MHFKNYTFIDENLISGLRIVYEQMFYTMSSSFHLTNFFLSIRFFSFHPQAFLYVFCSSNYVFIVFTNSSRPSFQCQECAKRKERVQDSRGAATEGNFAQFSNASML
jgi:hypothetical protein